jgi:hypothetical protein
MAQLTYDSKLKDLLENPQTKAILEKHLGELLKDPRIKMGLAFPLRNLMKMAPKGVIPTGAPEAIEADLKKLSGQ